MTNEIKFADILKELISKKGITQTALAEYLGLKSQTVSLYCNGKSYPEFNNLLKIASYFDVSTDYLITGEHTEYTDIRENLHLSDKAIENLKNQKDNLARNVLLSDEKFYKKFSEAIEMFLSCKVLFEAITPKESVLLNPEKLDLLQRSVLAPCLIMNNYFIDFFNEFWRYFPSPNNNNQE